MRYREFVAAYIMTNRPYGTLYVGVTSNLVGRAHQNREGLIPGFTRRWGLKRLVWYEPHDKIVGAIRRCELSKRVTRALATSCAAPAGRGRLRSGRDGHGPSAQGRG